MAQESLYAAELDELFADAANGKLVELSDDDLEDVRKSAIHIRSYADKEIARRKEQSR